MPEQRIQLDQLSKDIRTFWEKKQEEFGEGLIKFSYGILSTPEKSPAQGKCGIVYLMEKHLCFEDFYKAPLFFQNKTPEFTKTQLKIPRASIANVEILRQKEFGQRFLGQEPSSGIFQSILNIFRQQSTYLVVTEAPGTKASETYIFRDLDEPERWFEVLGSSPK